MTASYEDVWTEAANAALDLVGRTGARALEIGYLHEDVPPEQADWYAQVTYQGARIIEEHHIGPAPALEALAAQLLTGAMCNHCKGLVALTREGAAFFGGAFTHGATMTVEEARARPQCQWRREGARWIRGCEKP